MDEHAGGRRTTVVAVDGDRFARTVVTTPWLESDSDLTGTLERCVVPHTEPGDVVLITEKVVVVTTGRAVPAVAVVPGRLAHLLSKRVQPIGNSRGLSIPEKMEYVLRDAGRVRVLIGAALAALSRPFGLRGAFYVVVGDAARALDGMRAPYDDVLLPPLDKREAKRIAIGFAVRLGREVAIVDMNDRGGHVRAVSGGPLSVRKLRRVLADNPLGQKYDSTPVGFVRRLHPGQVSSAAAGAAPRGGGPRGS